MSSTVPCEAINATSLGLTWPSRSSWIAPWNWTLKDNCPAWFRKTLSSGFDIGTNPKSMSSGSSIGWSSMSRLVKNSSSALSTSTGVTPGLSWIGAAVLAHRWRREWGESAMVSSCAEGTARPKGIGCPHGVERSLALGGQRKVFAVAERRLELGRCTAHPARHLGAATVHRVGQLRFARLLAGAEIPGHRIDRGDPGDRLQSLEALSLHAEQMNGRAGWQVAFQPVEHRPQAVLGVVEI